MRESAGAARGLQKSRGNVSSRLSWSNEIYGQRRPVSRNTTCSVLSATVKLAIPTTCMDEMRVLRTLRRSAYSPEPNREAGGMEGMKQNHFSVMRQMKSETHPVRSAAPQLRSRAPALVALGTRRRCSAAGTSHFRSHCTGRLRILVHSPAPYHPGYRDCTGRER